MPLPPLSGRRVRVKIARSLGPHLAAASILRRTIFLDSEVLSRRGDFERILVHELFHFAWVRLSNAVRRDWERILEVEIAHGVQGELGWSAEWRKARLRRFDPTRRTPAWRRYACESFCDTAAWRLSGLSAHEEFTLARGARRPRRLWFDRNLLAGPIAI